jgi:hypothetical protein
MRVESWVESSRCRDRLRRRRRCLSPDFPLGDAVEVFVRREDGERLIAEVRSDDPEVGAKLRIEERELDKCTRNEAVMGSGVRIGLSGP